MFFYQNHLDVLKISVLSLWLFFTTGQLPAQPDLPRRTVLPKTLLEVSGMTKNPDGTLWLLNDSPHPPELYRYALSPGQLLETRRLPALNRDWEDLARDDQGRLYIGDFGNNRNARRNLRIYRFDPATGALDSILFRYPDQHDFPPARERDRNFDCEALVFHRDSLHLFSKSRFKGNFFVKHYVLPASPAPVGPDGKTAEYLAELRDSIRLPNRVVSGAALSRDGRTLALTSYIVGKKWGFLPYTKATVFFFSDFSGSHFFQGKRTRKRLPKFLIARQFESVAHWDGRLWLAANEGRASQKPAIWRVRQPR